MTESEKDAIRNAIQKEYSIKQLREYANKYYPKKQAQAMIKNFNDKLKRGKMVIKKRIVSEFTGLPITVNADKTGRRYTRNRHRYCGYHSCEKCKNASWYDDDYCNNQQIDFIDKENSKTTAVYCENYELREECQN